MNMTCKCGLVVLLAGVAGNLCAGEGMVGPNLTAAVETIAVPTAETAAQTVTPVATEVTPEVASRLASLQTYALQACDSARIYTTNGLAKLYNMMPASVQKAADKTYSFVGQHKRAVVITAGVAATLLVAALLYKKLAAKTHDKENKQDCDYRYCG